MNILYAVNADGNFKITREEVMSMNQKTCLGEPEGELLRKNLKMRGGEK